MVNRILKQIFFGRQRSWQVPAGVQAPDYDQLRMRSASGAWLSAWLGQPTQYPVLGSVLLMHPFRVDAKGYLLKQGYADVLRAQGYEVLLVDFNGWGASQQGGFNFYDDVHAALDYLAARHPERPIGIVGVSAGGANSINALALRAHPNVRALVAESAYTQLAEYWQRYPVASRVLRIMRWLRPALYARNRPEHTIRQMPSDVQVLLLYGGRDSTTPAEMGQRIASNYWRYHAASIQNLQLEIFDSSEHLQLHTDEPERYWQLVVGFLNTHVAGRTPMMQEKTFLTPTPVLA